MRRFIERLFRERSVYNMTDPGRNVATADIAPGSMAFEPILEDGVFRFDCSASDRDAAFPSLSFVNPNDRDIPIMTNKIPLYIPTFECVLGQQIVQIELPAGTSFYGTGEVSGQLERTGKRVFTWNTAAWGYGPGTTSLYQSHPWVLAVLPTGEALGVLADTTRRCEIDLRKEATIKFIAPSSYPVITFGPFASPEAVFVSLSHAIGNFFPQLSSSDSRLCLVWAMHLVDSLNKIESPRGYKYNLCRELVFIGCTHSWEVCHITPSNTYKELEGKRKFKAPDPRWGERDIGFTKHWLYGGVEVQSVLLEN